MATQTIPTLQGVPYYTQITSLEGTNYVFAFSYNQRQSTWRLSIGLPNGDGDPTPLASVKLFSNWPLLRRLTDTRLPPGELIAVCNPKGDKSPPGLNDFGPGLRVQLMYFPSSDLELGTIPLPIQVAVVLTCTNATAGTIYTVNVSSQVIKYTVPSGATASTVATAVAALLATLGSVSSASAVGDVITIGVTAGTPVTMTTA
jgi:hypothetical protein